MKLRQPLALRPQVRRDRPRILHEMRWSGLDGSGLPNFKADPLASEPDQHYISPAPRRATFPPRFRRGAFLQVPGPAFTGWASAVSLGVELGEPKQVARSRRLESRRLIESGRILWRLGQDFWAEPGVA